MLAVDLNSQKFIVYDCVEGRPRDTFLIEVKKLRTFVKDWMEYVPPNNEGSEDGAKSEIIEVDTWKFESGICTKMPKDLIAKHG